MQVAVDPVEMEQLQLFERVALTLLRSGDQRTHTLCLGFTVAGLGRHVGHASACPMWAAR
jgi:hypothetical protein